MRNKENISPKIQINKTVQTSSLGDGKLNYLVPCQLETFQNIIVQIKAT